jgi:hypothetical protein
MLLTIDVGIKNLAICCLDETTKQIILWKIINIGYGNDICKAIVAEFNSFHETVKGSVVLIERQMTRKMTNIQCYIEMYFRMQGHTEVIIYSPVHKLCGSGQENSGKGKRKYAARKKASIDLCKTWIDANPQSTEMTELWTATKKKDDLADTLCMALSYIKNPVNDLSNITRPVNARKPTLRQEASGQYSKSNIKYLLQNLKNKEAIPLKLNRSIVKFWKSLDACMAELKIRRA